MRTLLIATAIAAMLTSTAAIAQQSTPPMMGQQMPMMSQGWMGNDMTGHGMMPMMGQWQHIEGRLAFLKTEIKITDSQAPQWNAFADALRANAKRMGEVMNEMMSSGMMGQGVMMQGQAGTTMSLPDRLNWAEQHMATHMEMLQAVKGPTEALYSALSEEQKQTADQLIGPMGMM